MHAAANAAPNTHRLPGKPWRWNPVQGGSWQNRPARVLACDKPTPNRICTAVVPRNWCAQAAHGRRAARAWVQHATAAGDGSGKWQRHVRAQALTCCARRPHPPTPRAGQQLLEDVVMKADITLQADHVHLVRGGSRGASIAPLALQLRTLGHTQIKPKKPCTPPRTRTPSNNHPPTPTLTPQEHTLEYSGATSHPPRIQELPAVFVTRRLGRLVFYDGPAPWTGGALQARRAARATDPLLRARRALRRAPAHAGARGCPHACGRAGQGHN